MQRGGARRAVEGRGGGGGRGCTPDPTLSRLLGQAGAPLRPCRPPDCGQQQPQQPHLPLRLAGASRGGYSANRWRPLYGMELATAPRLPRHRRPLPPSAERALPPGNARGVDVCKRIVRRLPVRPCGGGGGGAVIAWGVVRGSCICGQSRWGVGVVSAAAIAIAASSARAFHNWAEGVGVGVRTAAPPFPPRARNNSRGIFPVYLCGITHPTPTTAAANPFSSFHLLLFLSCCCLN